MIANTNKYDVVACASHHMCVTTYPRSPLLLISFFELRCAAAEVTDVVSV